MAHMVYCARPYDGPSLSQCGCGVSERRENIRLAYGLIWQRPGALANLLSQRAAAGKSRTCRISASKRTARPVTATSSRSGDSPAASQFRSGPGTVLLGITVARLVTLELENRRR
jgi:hypothetical protein